MFLLNCERSEAKNYAAKNANGEFLLFVDSDMKLDSHVVEECVRKCISDNAQAIIIHEEKVSYGLIGECRKTEKTLSRIRRN